MTCIAWNPAADPFMFATGTHDGTVQIWTTPEMPLGNSRPNLPTSAPRTEAPTSKPAELNAVHLAPSALRESGHRYIPGQDHNSTIVIDKRIAPCETPAVKSEPYNDFVSRRHSWV
jgi:WD40 repeat protein